MKNKKRKIIFVILILMIVSSISLVYMYNFKNNEETSTYVETEYPDNYVFYLDGKLSFNTTWPSRSEYQYNKTASYCTDGSRIKYDGIINRVDIEVTGSTKCFLYFDSFESMGKETLAEHVKSLETTPESVENQVNYVGDAYRYRGIDPDNYVCIGTTDVDTCLGDEYLYLHRIISASNVEYSATSDDKTDGIAFAVKVITSNTVGTNTNRTAIEWRDTSIEDYLTEQNESGYYYERIVEMGNGTINNMILRAKYFSGGTSFSGYGYQYLELEQNYTKTNPVYENIGLLYPSDLAYSAIDTTDDPEYCYEGTKTTFNAFKNYCESWLDIGTSYHTMLGYSSAGSSYVVTNTGRLLAATSSTTTNEGYRVSGIRPVFYLQPETYIVSGTGTLDDPYMVAYEPDNNYEEIVKNYFSSYTVTGVKGYTNTNSDITACLDNSTDYMGFSDPCNYQNQIIGVYNVDYKYQPNLASGNTTWVEGNDYLLKLSTSDFVEGDIINNNYQDSLNYLSEDIIFYSFNGDESLVPYIAVKAKWDVTDISNSTMCSIKFSEMGYYEKYKISYSYYDYWGLLNLSNLIDNAAAINVRSDSKEDYGNHTVNEGKMSCIYYECNEYIQLFVQSGNIFFGPDFSSSAESASRFATSSFYTYPDDTEASDYYASFYIYKPFLGGVGAESPYRVEAIT